ncbi:hypothetical protein CSC12_1128 [Klebsiella michiganensis]|nr:hypothetical protein CSC12_1128 [Klebsiella michiganensis]
MPGSNIYLIFMPAPDNPLGRGVNSPFITVLIIALTLR